MDLDSSNIHIVRLQNTISSFHKGAKMYVLYISELGLSNANSKPGSPLVTLLYNIPQYYKIF
ncbi:hypothetical protein NMY3_03018 [Candidatus Nitrosocosmicus oleophilus]|jgi:hypothetical protein|uniref:Uncharacterized protein n=1 Tax=Candidatus Nitrosocosmicus oleophilus TaxID=1353260 RepID=A0A654M165_9ARCH|nr:hypothetical protein NMY3_03018 [Candidatus Nitrosocosmicus oleophilus]